MKKHLPVMLAIGLGWQSCNDPDDKVSPSDTTPEFLLNGWINADPTGFAATTYDFNQVNAAGKRTVEIRRWQRIGSLGFQSNQTFTALFTATEAQINFSSATGYTDTWDILARTPTSMDVSTAGGSTLRLFNCQEPTWDIAGPYGLIKASTKSCR